ncbi:MAG: RsbRD N-terminal domain-containing protein [Acidobacteria bacterium]|nr:RsbRD N-terminal domain-containing protein [Acidobacteriota bacterium]
MAPEPVLTNVCRVFAQEWLACTLRTYPAHTNGMFREAGGPFRNPVGSTLRAALTGLTDELFGDFDRERATALVDVVVRLRAVQDFPPAGVTGFVAFARQAARVAETGSPGIPPGLLDLVQRRVTELCDVADVCLAKCRGDLRAIGERAARRRVFVPERLQARAAARAAACGPTGPFVSRVETP